MSNQRIGYSRVSTVDQNPDSQKDALQRASVARIFIDHYSGTKASRPELDKMRQHLRPGDTVVITRLDRLGRSTKDLLNLVAEFQTLGVNLEALEQPINTSTPEGRLFFTMVAAFAEFEHDLIVARTREGLAAAKARGRNGGRKPKLDGKKIEMAKQMRAMGRPVVDIAAALNVSRPTLYRYLQEE